VAQRKGQPVDDIQKEASPDPDHIFSENEFVDALLALGRFSPERVEAYTADKFESKTNSAKALRRAGLRFSQVKRTALAKMEERGLCEPAEAVFGKGRYLIVGDSHGKHTTREIFALIGQLQKRLGIRKVVHVGHMLDDDGDVSYLWEDVPNLLAVAKPEELETLHGIGMPLVKEQVMLGDRLVVTNQELISDYVRTPLGGLDQGLFPGNIITNLHRHERGPRCTPTEWASYIASPGCLCTPHIIKTIRQIDFTSGYTVKVAYPDGFIKYRRAKQLMNYWTQGVLIVDVDASGRAHTTSCRIMPLSGKTVGIAFCGRIYTSKGEYKPDRLSLVVADAHAPQFSLDALDVQRQVAERLGGSKTIDDLIDLGDVVNFKSLCHHEIDKGRILQYANISVLGEAAAAHWVLKQRRGWAKNALLLFANHERFADDFVNRNPQFADLLSLRLLLGAEQLGYRTAANQTFEDVGAVRVLHGDLKLNGQRGFFMDKISQAMMVKDRVILMGHVHYNAIRRNTYAVGLTGEYDQGYNETIASTWGQGMAVVTQRAGVPFVQLVDICPDGTCMWDGKLLHAAKTKAPDFAGAKLQYEFRR